MDEQMAASDSPALYVHLHPSYFGLIVYDPAIEQVNRMDTVIHHPSLADNDPAPSEEIDQNLLQAWLGGLGGLLNRPFGPVRICVSTNKFNLLNNEGLADEDAFALVNQFETTGSTLRTDKIREDLFIQFAIPNKLERLLCSHFEPESIHFGDRGLIQLLSTESEIYSDGVYCQLLGPEAAVIVISDKKLVFYNKYKVRNREDLLYYLLLCYQGHDLDPNSKPLFLSGLIESGSPMFDLVRDYVRNVEFMQLPGPVKFTEDREQSLPLHYFINLLGIR